MFIIPFSPAFFANRLLADGTTHSWRSAHVFPNRCFLLWCRSTYQFAGGNTSNNKYIPVQDPLARPYIGLSSPVFRTYIAPQLLPFSMGDVVSHLWSHSCKRNTSYNRRVKMLSAESNLASPQSCLSILCWYRNSWALFLDLSGSHVVLVFYHRIFAILFYQHPPLLGNIQQHTP